MNDEEEGKGSKEEDDKHNNLDSNNDPQQGENEEEGLDAANGELNSYTHRAVLLIPFFKNFRAKREKAEREGHRSFE